MNGSDENRAWQGGGFARDDSCRRPLLVFKGGGIICTYANALNLPRRQTAIRQLCRPSSLPPICLTLPGWSLVRKW